MMRGARSFGAAAALLVATAVWAVAGCQHGNDTGADAGPGPSDAAAAADAVRPDAGPVGPFAVGVTTRTFVDPSRPTPPNGAEPGKPSRTLATEIWYPAMGDPAAPGATRDATTVPGARFPLVLFVHGSSSGRVLYSYLTIGLARAGFVVVAADFPLTALGTAGGSSDVHVTDQVGDLRFLADRLAAADADVGDNLHGAVDATRYAVVGHSTGGAVATLAAYGGDDDLVTHDPRVAAIVPISGDACMFDASFFQRRSVPVLIVGATNDLFVRVPNSGRWQYDHASGPRLLAELVGGQHVFFTDFPLPDVLANPVPTAPDSPLAVAVRAYGDAAACLPEPPAGTDPALSFDRQHALTIQLVAAYLDAQLRAAPAALDALVAAGGTELRFTAP
jgi:predicted dienelactone hydrolase